MRLKYMNKIKIIKNTFVIQFVQTDEKGLMLTPALWLGKGYAYGLHLEWLKWTIAIGVLNENS